MVFATIFEFLNRTTIQEMQAIVHPARLTVVADAKSIQEEVMALPEEDRALLLKQCHTTVEGINWFSACDHSGRLAYGWQAEFRSKQLWHHPALASYRYMLWMDTDVFAAQQWHQDPVDFLIQNKLVLLFSNWPQGLANKIHQKKRLKEAFGTTLCGLKLEKGRFKVKTGDCDKSMGEVHGMLHLSDMDFYRSSRVQKFINIWIGNSKYARDFDDQAAITAPVVFFAPDRAADMYANGIKLNVVHNGAMDGKGSPAKWLIDNKIAQPSEFPKGPKQDFKKFTALFPMIKDHFPRGADKCTRYVECAG